ncbi:MAG: alanine racemase [Chloroflexi bacterium]|nr:MAG: alanine racemase [Chloroflexota bacterium]RLC86267.1 MAG: alanine racemase [Chloroflexota bacterium]HEY73989.1 alanine racemase [Thermoflexia bacterium]
MIYLDDLLSATGGQHIGPPIPIQFPAFCYDSHRLTPGDLFVAVKTEGGGDGHDYIADAIEKWAGGVLCQFPPPNPTVPCIVVPDTQLALTDWAAHILRRHNPQVVGVTGSTSKTDTRRAISSVLAIRHRVFANPPALSSRFGLPISLAGLGSEHEVAVLEMACHAFGDIAHLAELTRPRIAVVTAVNRAHLAYLGSMEAIAQEKGGLVESLPPDGVAVLNYDDPRVRAMRERTRARIVTYGLSPDADIVASDLRLDREGLQFVVHFPGVSGLGTPGYPAKSEIRTRLLGRHQAHVVMAAIAVGLAYHVPWDDILDVMEELEPGPGRLRLLPGASDSLLLDGSASCSPATALQALYALADYPAQRRIAVLGDMAQLGGYSVEGHRHLGRVAAAFVDYLIVKGERATWIAEAAIEAGLPREHTLVTYTARDAVRHLKPQLKPGDVALVKGDVEARMEQVVEGLLADHADADRLVRRVDGLIVRTARPSRSTWTEVNLEAIAYNVRRIKEIVGPKVDILAVLKADAYGHGALTVARIALNNGASFCGVASVNEAVKLRDGGVDAPILVLGYTPSWLAKAALLRDVTLTLYDTDVARAFSRAATDLRRTARVHIKVDTGMGRLGLLPEQVVPFVEKIRALPGLDLEGIFTHFSVADDADLEYTRWQLARFREVLEHLTEIGVAFRIVHCANSAALLRLPETRFDMVRLGLVMYGLQPSPQVSLPPGFRPALAWKTTIAQAKTLPPGSYVSYGNVYRTEQEETIAVIPVGYADGFRRAPTRWQAVLVRGQRAPIVGRVCMDQTMVNVSHIPNARVGDEVVLIGHQGNDAITAEEVAGWLGTINYEVISEILARVPRVV